MSGHHSSECPLTIGDQVVYVFPNGQMENCVVKWIGTLPEHEDEARRTWVGVEFVSSPLYFEGMIIIEVLRGWRITKVLYVLIHFGVVSV